jgi:hypothetical protein
VRLGHGGAEGVVDNWVAKCEATSMDVQVGGEFGVLGGGGVGRVTWREEHTNFEVGSDIVVGLQCWLVFGSQVVVEAKTSESVVDEYLESPETEEGI